MSLKRKLNDCDHTMGAKKSLAEQELKVFNAVLKQGPIGRIVVQANLSQSPYVTLQNAVTVADLALQIFREPMPPNDFVMMLNNEEFARGSYLNMQLARIGLANETLEKLKKKCFFIEKKTNFIHINDTDLATEELKPSCEDKNNKALEIMKKMGWGGKGLGAQEQGSVDTVVLYENMTGHGFGADQLHESVSKTLEKFAQSPYLCTLGFETTFSKDERAVIHKLAGRYNLRTKSTGSGEDRRVLVSKRLSKLDVAKELLKLGGENEYYKLIIPTDFTDV